MNFATYTNVGTTRSSNQDSHCLLTATVNQREVCMAVVCDGVGGLSAGEVASSSVVRACADWFKATFPQRLAAFDEGFGASTCAFVEREWGGLLSQLNAAIFAHAEETGQRMGTTLTGMLYCDGVFQVAQVGDCRAYRVNSGGIEQLTEDQTLVNREVQRGTLTPEEARNHPQANVILQAVGARATLSPVFTAGTAAPGDVIVLCTDGFRHKVTEEELRSLFAPLAGAEEFQMQDVLEGVSRLVMGRGEHDNITALCFAVAPAAEQRALTPDDVPTLSFDDATAPLFPSAGDALRQLAGRDEAALSAPPHGGDPQEDPHEETTQQGPFKVPAPSTGARGFELGRGRVVVGSKDVISIGDGDTDA